MIQPNDVSLYSHISKSFLEKGKIFYNETIVFRLKNYGGRFPSREKQKEYYDYFETIIISIIFSYTSIETFVNICIPNNYKFTETKNGEEIINDKIDIEKRFSLRRKLLEIIREVLNTPDPSKEKWWSKLIELEDIRDEIIHTKQSKSEERYSKLLSPKIYHIIQVNQEIIRYYGEFISKNKKELLEEFPYDFGYDESIPGILTEKEWKNLQNLLS